MECKICKSHCEEIFNAAVLQKHSVAYYQCSTCQFIQTETPFWLDEAYSSVITNLDIGYIGRNNLLAEITKFILRHFQTKNGIYLDYGGGYGMFVRLMRDHGFNFYRHDIYCQNIFANFFDIVDLENSTNLKFDLLTCFEVFEHLENPINEIETMLQHSSSILFTTQIQPKITFKSEKEWWYFSPETGQHIAFYTKNTLQFIAKHFNCRLYSNGINLHLLTQKQYYINPTILASIVFKLKHPFQSNGLISTDLQHIIQKSKVDTSN